METHKYVSALCLDGGFNRCPSVEAALDAVGARLVILNARGCIVAANRAWRDSAKRGGARNAEIGADYLAVCDRGAARGDSSALYAARAAREIRAALTGSSTSSIFEYTSPCDGGLQWFSHRVEGFISAGERFAVVAHADVTDRNLVREDAQRSHALLSAVIRSTQSYVILAEEGISFQILSGGPKRPFGQHSPGLRVAGIRRRMPRGDWRKLQRAFLRVGRGSGDTQIDCSYRAGRRGVRKLRVKLTRLSGDPSGNRIVISADDVTEFRQLSRQMNQANKLSTMGEMAAGVAHELNQPLSVIAMAAELLLDELQGREAREQFLTERAERIQAMCRRATHLVGQLRLFAHGSEPSFTEVDPAVCMDEAVEMAEVTTRTRNIFIHLEPGRTSSRVIGSAAQLTQVFLNLLLNAVDAASNSAEAAFPGVIRVTLGNVEDGRAISISVEDNGPGFAAEALQRAFEPFYTTKERGKGMGLGLSMSHGIIQSHGGRMEIENLMRGARVTVILPTVAREFTKSCGSRAPGWLLANAIRPLPTTTAIFPVRECKNDSGGPE